MDEKYLEGLLSQFVSLLEVRTQEWRSSIAIYFQSSIATVSILFSCSKYEMFILFQVKSKLPILSSYTDATEGLVTHGWITKIEKHGCFVRFYNGVQGFVPRSLLHPFVVFELPFSFSSGFLILIFYTDVFPPHKGFG